MTDLWFAVEHEAHTHGALQVKQVVFDALKSKHPRATLNMGLRRLRGRDVTLRDVRRWLDSDPVAVAAQLAGAYWALVEWRRAMDDLLAGMTPHRAFGMATRGRVHSTNFSLCDNIAAYVEHRRRSGHRIVDILKDVRGTMKAATPDDRTLRFARRKLSGLSDADITQMGATARCFYHLP